MISKIAVPLKTCTVMDADIAGASVLQGLFDLSFDKKINVDSINRCIDEICGNQTALHHKTTGNRHNHVYDNTTKCNHVRKSWLSGTSTTLLGWGYNTGGSRSIPTVHPCLAC